MPCRLSSIYDWLFLRVPRGFSTGIVAGPSLVARAAVARATTDILRSGVG
jgi:hypothetical protein